MASATDGCNKPVGQSVVAEHPATVFAKLSRSIFNLPVFRMKTAKTCVLGATIDAAVGTGMFGSFREAADSMVKEGRAFIPDPDNHRTYQRLYRDVFLPTYKAMAPIYRRSARITGYPE